MNDPYVLQICSSYIFGYAAEARFFHTYFSSYLLEACLAKVVRTTLWHTTQLLSQYLRPKTNTEEKEALSFASSLLKSAVTLEMWLWLHCTVVPLS